MIVSGRFLLGLAPLALLLPSSAAAQDRPRLTPVKIERYQFSIMSAFSDCMLRDTQEPERDADAVDRELEARTEPCRFEVLALIDNGELRREGRKLTPRQRRDSIRVMNQTAANLRESRRYYGADPMRGIDPEGPIAKGVLVLDPVAPQFERYSACVMGRVKYPPYMTPVTVEKAIEGCATLRGQLGAEADAILARQPDYADPARRGAAIAEMFDDFDAMVRGMGRGEGFLSSPERETK